MFTGANSRLALVAKRVEPNRIQKQLCHASQADIRRAIFIGSENLQVPPGSFVSCMDFMITKSGKVSQPQSASNDIGSIGKSAYADLTRPTCIESIGRVRLIICLMNASGRLRHVKFLDGKTPVEVLAPLEEFYALMNTQTGLCIKGVWSNRGK
jgi:hypothetical protein